MTERDDDTPGSGSGFPGGHPEGSGSPGRADDPWSRSAGPPHRAGGEGYGGGGPGYGSGPPPAPPYGYGSGYGGGYGYPARQISTNAVVALVLAIASYPICPIVFAVVALVVARSADREIAASGGLKEGAGMVRAARIVSWINIALFGGLIVLFVVLGLAGYVFSGWSLSR